MEVFLAIAFVRDVEFMNYELRMMNYECGIVIPSEARADEGSLSVIIRLF
jgi:hypothetical protein